MKHITCIEDLRQVHMRKVPKAFFDYADRGSYSDDTLLASRDDLQQIKFRQRVLVDVSKRDLSTKILGEPAALPLILAPVGLTGMQFGDGEIHACRAAQAAGIPFTLSTMSICSIEDVAESVDKPFWFQLYVMKDRGFIKALIERAIAAKCSALVVSNHGGRQLDGAPSSIEVLPEIADTVGSQIEIMFDGGIRSGQDVMRALALGAKSCMIGRAYIHGLGAFGGPGVAKAIELIAAELSTTMGLCGVNTIAEIDDHVLAVFVLVVVSVIARSGNDAAI